VYTGSMPVGHILEDTTQIQTGTTVVDARPSTPTDPDYFEAIVSGRAFILDDPVLRDWLDNPEIRQTATVVYGLNPQGERVDGLGLTLDTGQTVLIHREDLGHVHSGQLAADSETTALFERKATGTVTQTPESRMNAELAPRAGVSYLPDVIDPDSAAVVAIVAELRSHGRLRPGMTQEEVFAVVQAEMARRYQYQLDGDRDAWQSAQDTLQRGRGDCEDWSIATASVLARALHVTGHSPDGVQLYIIADGDQAHMVVAYAGLVWDSKQPDRLTQSSVSSVVIITQSKLRVVDDTAVDWLLAVGTASGTARSERGKAQSEFQFIAQVLASKTSKNIHRMMHGDDSELVDIGKALAKGEITQQQLKGFLAMQREFDAMRALFVILMHVVQQRGKWIRLILAIIEGVEESKNPSDHKYSFEGINFNQLTQSLFA
jgi:predicted transglutaminase-like cysteine proteinase